VINREPVLVGIVARDGGEPGAVIRTGEQFRDTSVGTVLRDGWTVAEIQTNRVILKRGTQRRTLELGGDS
jgi:hypothetical protein